MTENQLIALFIDKYTDLQRIRTAKNSEREINLQLAIVKTKLTNMGIATENLDL